MNDWYWNIFQLILCECEVDKVTMFYVDVKSVVGVGLKVL